MSSATPTTTVTKIWMITNDRSLGYGFVPSDVAVRIIGFENLRVDYQTRVPFRPIVMDAYDPCPHLFDHFSLDHYTGLATLWSSTDETAHLTYSVLKMAYKLKQVHVEPVLQQPVQEVMVTEPVAAPVASITPVAPKMIEVTIALLTGARHYVNVPLNASVLHVKKALALKLHVPPAQQCLILHGKQLADENTLDVLFGKDEAYNLLHMVPRFASQQTHHG